MTCGQTEDQTRDHLNTNQMAYLTELAGAW